MKGSKRGFLPKVSSPTVSHKIYKGAKQLRLCCSAVPIHPVLRETMQRECFHGDDKGIRVNFRTNGRLFNLQRVRAKTKMREQLVRGKYINANDCGKFAHCVKGLQSLMDSFPNRSGHLT